MAAPTLFAQGSIAATTTGNLTVGLPGHQADDVLIVGVSGWVPNTALDANAIDVPAGWTQIAQLATPATGINGRITWFWRRATSATEADPVFTRPTLWDTGNDTCFAGRAYTIRGCATTGDPWDEADPTAVYNTANQAFDAVTVSATERTVIQFFVSQDNNAPAGGAPAGWTAGVQHNTPTGTDAGAQTYRKENVSADTGADTPTIGAPAQGYYAFLGISFKPPAASETPISGSDSPVLSETASVTADPSANDSASTSETTSGTDAGPSATDSVALTEGAVTLSAPPSASDSASASETASIASFSSSSGTLLPKWADQRLFEANEDFWFAGPGEITETPISASDSATGTETAAVTASPSGTDSASATDSASVLKFPTTDLIDNFNRTDETPIGAPWVNSIYAADQPINLAGNNLQNSSLTTWGSVYYDVAYGPDVENYVTIAALGLTVPAPEGLELAVKIVDGDTATPDGYFVHIASPSGTWQFWKIVDGAQSTIGATVTGPTLAVGDKIGVQVIGSTLRAWHKPAAGSWTEILSRTDATYEAVSGRIGYLIEKSSWRLDDASGGTVSAAEPKSGSDLFTESDASSLAPSVSTSDSGIASETASLSAELSGTDSATAAEGTSAIGNSSADSASASETAEVSVATDASETGALAEGVPEIGLLASESAALSETSSVSVSISASDSAALSEGVPAIGITASDSAVLADNSSSQVEISASDSASLSDIASLDTGGIAKSGSDSGAVLETSSVEVTVSASDSGAGQESAELAAALSGSDSIAGSELANLIVSLAVSESPAFSAQASLAAAITAIDSGALSESVDISGPGLPPVLISVIADIEIRSLTAVAAELVARYRNELGLDDQTALEVALIVLTRADMTMYSKSDLSAEYALPE